MDSQGNQENDSIQGCNAGPIGKLVQHLANKECLYGCRKKKSGNSRKGFQVFCENESLQGRI